jgi:hypothetical protein
MQSLPSTVQPYTTSRAYQYFYFPKEGEFPHFPTSISIEGTVVAKANANQLKVVKHATINKKETFRDIL